MVTEEVVNKTTVWVDKLDPAGERLRQSFSARSSFLKLLLLLECFS